MAFLTGTFARAAFKRLYGLAHTSNSSDPANESIPSSMTLASQDIMAPSAPIPTSPAQAVANNIGVQITCKLVAIPGNENAYRAHINEDDLPSLAGLTNPLTGQAYVNNDIVGHFIPPSYGAGYRILLYRGAAIVPPLDTSDWFFDYKAGVVFSESPLNLGENGTVVGYVYIGNFLSGLLSNMESNPASSSKWTQTGNTIYNNNIGNVGIGTTSPATKLHVAGSLRSSSLEVLSGSNYSLRASSSSVGINTGSPNATLDIRSTQTLSSGRLFEIQNSSVMRTALGANGVQTWNISDNTVEVGSITLGTHYSEPTVVFDTPNTRSIIKGKSTGSGGFHFSSLGGAFGTTPTNYVTITSGNTASAPNLYMMDDSNTGLFYPEADTLAFSTFGVERLRINSSGNMVATGLLQVADGSETAPSLSMANDTDVGLFRPATNTLAFTTGSTERLRINSTGNMVATGTLQVSNGTVAAPSIRLTAEATGLYRHLDASSHPSLGISVGGVYAGRWVKGRNISGITVGGIIIDTNDTHSILHVGKPSTSVYETAPAAAIEAWTQGNTVFGAAAVAASAYNTENTAYPGFITRRSRGTFATPAAVQANDILGSFTATGNYSSSAPGVFNNSAIFEVVASQAFSASAAGSNWIFKTAADNSITPSERLRLNAIGATITGDLRVGGSDTSNVIAFRGTSGDNAGGYNHTYIGERVYAGIGTEQSELFLFKGNDPVESNGPDRIRLGAAEIAFDTYTANLSGTFEAVAGSGSLIRRMTILNNGNVGIGTTTPSHRLHVQGTLNVTGAATLGSTLDVTSTTTSSKFIPTIDGPTTGFGMYRTAILDGNALAFSADGNEVARMTSLVGVNRLQVSGRVGINTSAQTSMHIAYNNFSGASDGIRITNAYIPPSNSGSVAYWDIYTEGGMTVESVAVETKYLRFRYNGGSNGGYLSPTANVDNITFTGQHRNLPDGALEVYSDSVGLIVVSTGTYASISGGQGIAINEALPVVALSTVRNQKNAFGVVSDSEDQASSTREHSVGVFVSVYEKPEGDNRLIINSLGEGAIWVCNINGNLENGDYITTCEIPGYGMKQDDDLMHNYTVAKITCDCDFDLNSNVYVCEEFTHDNTTYRRAFVGCTYHCG